MRHPAARLLLAVLLVGGCDRGSTPEDGPVELDSLHVELLADLHLAAARAELTGEPLDSLRGRALSAHGLDSMALGALLDSYAERPEEASALHARVADRLTEERRNW